MLSSDIMLPRIMYRTANELNLCHCVSSSGISNGLVLSLPNIGHPHFCLGLQRHRCTFRSPVLHILNAIGLTLFFFLHSSILSATRHNTSANKWFHFHHRCFPGTLMTTDVSGGGITSQVANDQRVGRCPYSTQVCALTLGDSFFARCSLAESKTFSHFKISDF